VATRDSAGILSTAGQGYDAPYRQQPAFGVYAPTPLQWLLINLARHTPLGRGRIRWLVSDAVARVRPGPVDVSCYGFKQRLHHYGKHFVEKKMLLHIQDYDKPEFSRLRSAIRPGFHFVDVGANAGIYVFRVKSWDPGARILAVEANPRYAERLKFNVAANDLKDVSVVNAAAGAAQGTAPFYLHHDSMLGSGPSIDVPVMALHDMLRAEGFDRVDAMKMDIEGFEDRVLPPFFETAPRSLWPRLLILEAWTTGIVDLCVAHGYRVNRTACGANVVLELTAPSSA
jgi:FkbM family methyltransferase